MLPPSLVDEGGFHQFVVRHDDKAHNEVYASQYFTVDTVAPELVSVEPTGRFVRRSAKVLVTSNGSVYESSGFENVYERGSSTPLAVNRNHNDTMDASIEIVPKRYLKRDTWYTVKVTTRVNDGVNNLEVPKTWSLKTK